LLLSLFSGGHGVVRLWDAAGGGGKCVAHFLAHRWGVTSMCFSSDDRLLCTVGGDDHRRTQV
ncbi:unnamed protein product, partial [Laminaria digitata]